MGCSRKGVEPQIASHGMINLTAFLLLGLGMLLVFPPFGDFLQGK